jgi:hypothetical protein
MPPSKDEGYDLNHAVYLLVEIVEDNSCSELSQKTILNIILAAVRT